MAASSRARVSLAEVFHPWVQEEWPGSGFESLSIAGGTGGVCKSRISLPPPGIEVEKHSFRTAWLITGQAIQRLRLKLKAFILTVQDLNYYESGWLGRFEVCEFFQGIRPFNMDQKTTPRKGAKSPTLQQPQPQPAAAAGLWLWLAVQCT